MGDGRKGSVNPTHALPRAPHPSEESPTASCIPMRASTLARAASGSRGCTSKVLRMEEVCPMDMEGVDMSTEQGDGTKGRTEDAEGM